MKINPNWPVIEFGEVVEFFDHKRVPLSSKEREQRKGSYPYYGASGIIDYVDDYIFDGRYLLIAEDGENLYSRKTPIAFFGTGKFWVNNHAHIVRALDGVADDYFLKAWFDQANISGFITGAAQPKLSQANLRKIKISLPPLPSQRRIASILSAYDDLIENNTRRIQILEQMAQMIYREWFVKFRFPGHEAVKMVETKLGMAPEGWEVKEIREILTRLPKGVVYTEKETSQNGKVVIIDQSRSDFLGFHNNIPDFVASPANPIAIFGDHTCKMCLMVEPFSVGPNVVPFKACASIPITYTFFVVNGLIETRVTCPPKTGPENKW